MINSVPDEPAGLFTEGGDTYGIGGLNIGAMVTDAADEAGQDATSWHIILAFTLAAALALFVYKKTHDMSIGQRGSLLLSMVAGELVLVIFYIYSTIPGLVLIPCGIMALALIVWRKSPAPVD